MDILRKVSTTLMRKEDDLEVTLQELSKEDGNDDPTLEVALTNVYGIGCMITDVRRSLLDVSPASKDDEDAEEGDGEGDGEDESSEEGPGRNETFAHFCDRQTRNVLHFLVEDWCLSAMLGVITAVLSVGVDLIIEKLQHLHVLLFAMCDSYSIYLGVVQWIVHVVLLTFIAALACLLISKQAVGSGIPEVKVIMHGFKMKNYLTFRTLIAKMFGLTLAIGGGLPIGKEGPFVHMGAIVATLLSKLTKACQYSAFFSNEGREMEMLSSGCAVGIACTFSAPVGAVLYAIESTSKYFAVKNYWRAFLAATCSAITFRFANFFVTSEQSGTITAFYQTSFPTESFLVEELPVFALVGLLGGLFAAMFIYTHRRITLFRYKNRLCKAIFGQNFFTFTICAAALVGVLTYPRGFGKYIAGKLTFRETLADFFDNCTLYTLNQTAQSCNERLMQHWTGAESESISVFLSLACYFATYFVLVAVCISINVPAGVFVPSFVIGAAGGRLIGEMMAALFPNGLRGTDGSPIYPGLYAVVGAAAYTGAVTHTLSVAVIICELTGQLTPILPVLIAMLMGNAICKFLQPSIYESIIRIKKYPYLPDLPPSRISVHTVKVEQMMIKDVVYITKSTTYRELREILRFSPQLRSFPVVTDRKNKILLGSVAKKYLIALMRRHLLAEQLDRVNKKTPSDLFHSIKRSSMRLSRRSKRPHGASEPAKLERLKERDEYLDDRSISGNTLLAISPLRTPDDKPLCSLFAKPAANEMRDANGVSLNRDELLDRIIDLDEVAIDSAPFQLVLGSSLYKVHTLFSLLGLSHAYVTDCGRLIGVIALKELRDALANIYVRGAVPVKVDRKLTSSEHLLPRMLDRNLISKRSNAGKSIYTNALTIPPNSV